MTGWQCYQLDHMQIICTSLQTGDHASISSLNCAGQMLFLTPSQQCQSTEGKICLLFMFGMCVRVCVDRNDEITKRFAELDKDQNGVLSPQEVVHVIQNGVLSPQEVVHVIQDGVLSPQEVVHVIENGVLSPQEVVHVI